MKYPKILDADGCYFRVERNGRYYNICYSDLTDEERDDLTVGRHKQWTHGLVTHLMSCIGDIDLTATEEIELSKILCKVLRREKENKHEN